MLRTTATMLCAFLLISFWGSLASCEEYGSPTPNVSELKELNRFAGSWDGSLGNSTEGIPSQRKWDLDGYFLKHTFSVSGGSLRGIIYRGYDTKAEHYTLTFLDSQGNSSLLIGYWNADLKTFIFEAVDSTCPVQKYESYFPNDKTEQWTIVFDSEKLNQISGVAKKRDE